MLNISKSKIDEKKSIPKKVSDIKAPKPKIKLVMEKETIVEDTVKALLLPKNMEMYQSLAVQRKTSGSFYKTSNSIIQEKKE